MPFNCFLHSSVWQFSFFCCVLSCLRFLQLTLAEVWFPPQFHKGIQLSGCSQEVPSIQSEAKAIPSPQCPPACVSTGCSQLSCQNAYVWLHRSWEEKACSFTLLICAELEVSWQFLTVFILQKQIQSLNKMCSNLLEKISKEERESESGGMSLRWEWGTGFKQQAWESRGKIGTLESLKYGKCRWAA